MSAETTVSETLLRKRRAWAYRILKDVAKRHGDAQEGMSMRKLASFLGVSHQTPATWLEGISVPSSRQVMELARLADRPPQVEMVRAEMLRATDTGLQREWGKIYRDMAGVRADA